MRLPTTSILFPALLLTTSLAVVGIAPKPAAVQVREAASTPSPTVAWDSLEGKRRLMRAELTTDFFQLADNFQPQINPLFCGVATTTIILNAFRGETGRVPSDPKFEVTRPEALGGGVIPFPEYSQATLLNDKTDKIKQRRIIELQNLTSENTQNPSQFDPGLTLDDLRQIQEAYGLDVKMTYAENDPSAGVLQFRKVVRYALSESKHFLIVNFVGKAIGNTTGGHISPLAAYDKESDSVLVLDVAGHKNSWYWVDLNSLYLAMHTMDHDHYRGWLLVSDPS